MQSRQNQTQRYKADVNTGKARLLLKVSPLGIAKIILLHADNPLILSELPSQLIGADIYRIDQLSSVLQHDICKTAG